jgi:hypothetical protein
VAVIHIAYATMKMPRPKGVITIKVDQWDTLACENTSLSHVGRFGDKTTQDQAIKAAKTQGGGCPRKASVSKPLTPSTLWVAAGTTTHKGSHVASAST